MMRKLTLAACLLSGTAMATTCVPRQLPRSPHADTEATTNCPFAFGGCGVRNFQFDMSFVGTASNNVQLAFGRDADHDGVLSASETDLTFAWECGAWRLSGVTPEEGLECAQATTNEVKVLHWDLRLSRRRPKDLTLDENGVTLAAELSDAPPPWLYNFDWDIFRLAVRGVDAPEEDVRVNLNIEGSLIILR